MAGAVPDDAIDRVAAVINAHPTVTHNYVRNHAYNLWFTISVPPAMGLERTLKLLATEAGVERFLPLRRTRTFKIGVNFDLTTRTSATAVEAIVAPAHLDPTPAEQAMFRALQTPLPLEPRPFEAPAAAAGVAPAELLAFARRHLGGAVRRYVATLRHRRVGVRGNGMAVWDVPTARQDEVGSQLARAPEVSHCYARNGIEGSPTPSTA